MYIYVYIYVYFFQVNMHNLRLIPCPPCPPSHISALFRGTGTATVGGVAGAARDVTWQKIDYRVRPVGLFATEITGIINWYQYIINIIIIIVYN